MNDQGTPNERKKEREREKKKTTFLLKCVSHMKLADSYDFRIGRIFLHFGVNTLLNQNRCQHYNLHPVGTCESRTKKNKATRECADSGFN